MCVCHMKHIAEEHDWHIQHAENSGEFYIGIGYFVDVYDKEKNVVLEYDEKKHYWQSQIIQHLHCEYWRYNETTATLWKVT